MRGRDHREGDLFSYKLGVAAYKTHDEADFAEMKGQYHVRGAVEVAAAWQS
jgi:hypothetical protein